MTLIYDRPNSSRKSILVGAFFPPSLIHIIYYLYIGHEWVQPSKLQKKECSIKRNSHSCNSSLAPLSILERRGGKASKLRAIAIRSSFTRSFNTLFLIEARLKADY